MRNIRYCGTVQKGLHEDMGADTGQQETMNFWKQTNHVMSFFKEENFRGDERLPDSFMSGFLEVRSLCYRHSAAGSTTD